MYINTNFSSKNFSDRVKKIEYIILHYTEMSFDSALSKLMDSKSQVSAHYLIKETGEVFRLVPDGKIAWHAGESFWRNSVKLNETSIGIEIDNMGDSEFTGPQMKACIDLCNDLITKHDIPRVNVVGHSDIAPTRKIDPGIFFNWELLAANGLGIWPNDVNKNYIQKEYYDISEMQNSLSKFGYKIQESGEFDAQTNAVLRAFQAHFCPHLIKEKGLDFYQNLHSIYTWDSYQEKLLESLLLQSNLV